MSGYQRYLPAFYHSDPFWARYLRPFEQIQSSGATVDGTAVVGLEQIIDRLHQHFSPKDAPGPFLPWLAGWVALSLREDWDEDTRRALIKEIASLYPTRGTPAGLEAVLRLYLKASGPAPLPKVAIIQPQALQVGVHSTVGRDTWVGGGRPHHFIVQVDFDSVTPSALKLRPGAVIDIVDREKPAHTYYDLQVLIPTMKVKDRSTVGESTVLGNKRI
jgi:phage tail-like protein